MGKAAACRRSVPAAQVGQGLCASRDARGLSLARLGELARCDRSYLARLERGEQFPSKNVAKARDEVLGTDGRLLSLWKRGGSLALPGNSGPGRRDSTRSRRCGEPSVFTEDARCLKCTGDAVSVVYHAAPADRRLPLPGRQRVGAGRASVQGLRTLRIQLV